MTVILSFLNPSDLLLLFGYVCGYFYDAVFLTHNPTLLLYPYLQCAD